MDSAIVPGIYDPALADVDVRVSTEDGYRVTRELARDEGLLVGISSGANLAGALRVAERVDRRQTPSPVFVVVFCDGGDRYLSQRFWDEADVSSASAGDDASEPPLVYEST
jgi:cysteine synthase B